jgi:hypothetical protein
MPNIHMPPIVNDQGNINVHHHEGCIIPIMYQDKDGTEIDISATPLFFEIPHGTFRKALDLDPANPEGRLLILTPDDLEDITSGAIFCVADETNPALPIHRWEGRIYKRG